MKTFSDQHELATYVRSALAAQLKRAKALAATADESALQKPREGGGWSPAAIFDHLSVMNRLYLPKIESATASAEPASPRNWKPTLSGRLLRWSVTTPLKMKTPALFRPPDPASDPNAVSRFLRSHEDLLRAVDRSSDFHWKSVRVSSPAASFVSLNLGDVFVVLADHGERHLKQIEALLTP